MIAGEPWFGSAAAFIVGACVGSFLNVVIRRLPAGESIVRPGSHCACGAPIAWRDKMPVISWLVLRGRARCCRRALGVQYPMVEIATAVLFLACWRAFSPGVAVCGWVFLGSLTAAAVIDAEHSVIPDVLTIGLAAIGFGLSLIAPGLHGEHSGLFALDSIRSGASALAGVLVGSGLLLWIAIPAEMLLKKEAMGFGDIKLIGAIGAFCGWRGAVFAIFGGAAVGTLWLALSSLGRTRADKAPRPAFGTRIPFGPMLAAAAALYFLFLRTPVDAWFARAAELL